MTLTNTVYPPAGATALLAAIDPTVQHLGWYLIPFVLLSTCLTLVVSLLVNNIQRRYPTYWWTPADLAKVRRGERDIEKVSSSAGMSDASSGERYVNGTKPMEVGAEGDCMILLTPERIVVPGFLMLAFEEREVLEILRNRLTQGGGKHVDSESDV